MPLLQHIWNAPADKHRILQKVSLHILSANDAEAMHMSHQYMTVFCLMVPGTTAEVLVSTDVCLKALEEEAHAALKLSLLVNYDLPVRKVRSAMQHLPSLASLQAFAAAVANLVVRHSKLAILLMASHCSITCQKLPIPSQAIFRISVCVCTLKHFVILTAIVDYAACRMSGRDVYKQYVELMIHRKQEQLQCILSLLGRCHT